MQPLSGIRWYRSFPHPLTKTVIAAANALWIGADPKSIYPYSNLTQLATFTGQASTPVCFAPVRDPAAQNGNGCDVLVITGFTGAYGCATGLITLSGTPAAGQTITVTVNATTTAAYTVLATDTLDTIATAVAAAINITALVTPGSPVLGQAVAVGNTIQIGALISGTSGNSYTYKATVTNAGMAATPSGTTNMTGGGASTSAPLKYDGSVVTALSYQITNAFTGCVSWHNHLWLWGDPNNPDTLYACDIDQPEGFSFMLQNGGYDIGQGDGDPGIRGVVPIGNILYVFKSNSIYAITGYDFQSGEYQFQVAPAFTNKGAPSKDCICVLGNAIIFWSGRSFYRLQAGAFTLEHLGAPIPITCGRIANGDQTTIRAVAGDFSVVSTLNESYISAAVPAWELYDSIAFFGVDTNDDGVPDTVLVYDDEASVALGKPAWSKWTGWTVRGWIPFGQGPNAAQTDADAPTLCWIDANADGTPQVYAYGTAPASDNGAAISWLAQTGWMTVTTGALAKQLHRLILSLESTPGVTITFTVTPAVTNTQAGNPTVYAPFSDSFGTTGGVVGAEAHQTLIATINPQLTSNAFLLAFGETSAIANFELIDVVLDYIEEAFTP